MLVVGAGIATLLLLFGSIDVVRVAIFVDALEVGFADDSFELCAEDVCHLVVGAVGCVVGPVLEFVLHCFQAPRSAQKL